MDQDQQQQARIWNWRQGTRTRITTGTTSAAFILDALDPLPDDAVSAAADTLTDALRAVSPGATVHRRLLEPPGRAERRSAR